MVTESSASGCFCLWHVVCIASGINQLCREALFAADLMCMGEIVLQKKTIISSWAIGLSDKQANLLRGYLGDEHHLVVHTLEDAAAMLDASANETPCIIWMSSGMGRKLCTLAPDDRQRFEQVSKALLLDESYSLSDFESACELGVTEIVRPPYARERIADIMRRALEVHSVHHDLNCMTREILLERELLERKNELLSFLVNFLTNTTESLDLEYILQTAYSGLSRLLPLRSMHVALWEQEGEGPCSVSLYICASERSKTYNVWRDALLSQIRHAVGSDFSIGETQKLQLHDQPREWVNSAPDGSVILPLPIVTGQERLGVLLLQTSMERHLGRDQALALDSAMRHLALSLKNARRFQRIQLHADYDALTKVHSRRHFEGRLDEELEHVARYGQPLSMLMLDIDHFKRINDTRGHHVGDIVLREVASLITKTVRSTDYCARYGGEEFVILLPHASSKKALYLAERIRKVIASHTFIVDGGDPLELTASLGVASTEPGRPKTRRQLLTEADAALYAAKAGGRNCTRENAA